MISPLIEAIKKDREDGTPGPWEYLQSMSHDGQEWLGCGVAVRGQEEFLWLENCAEVDILRARRIARVPDLEAALIAAEELAQSLEELISSSEGVYGLHANGDPAPWEEITAGGRFGEWLDALTAYRKATGAGQ